MQQGHMKDRTRKESSKSFNYIQWLTSMLIVGLLSLP